MTKQEFIDKLKSKLSSLPKVEVEDRLNFYIEMIDDRMEEGLSEDIAVADIGSVDKIAMQIAEDIPLLKTLGGKIKPKKSLSKLNLTLLIVGFPIWLPLLVSLFAIILSLYVSVWAVVLSLWACFISLVAVAIYLIITSILVFESVTVSGAMLGGGIVSIALSIFAFYGCKKATVFALCLIKKIIVSIKRCFIKKGGC